MHASTTKNKERSRDERKWHGHSERKGHTEKSGKDHWGTQSDNMDAAIGRVWRDEDRGWLRCVNLK